MRRTHELKKLLTDFAERVHGAICERSFAYARPASAAVALRDAGDSRALSLSLSFERLYAPLLILRSSREGNARSGGRTESLAFGGDRRRIFIVSDACARLTVCVCPLGRLVAARVRLTARAVLVDVCAAQSPADGRHGRLWRPPAHGRRAPALLQRRSQRRIGRARRRRRALLRAPSHRRPRKRPASRPTVYTIEESTFGV